MAKAEPNPSSQTQTDENGDQSAFSQADLDRLTNLDYHIIAEKVAEMMRRDLLMDRERLSQR